MIDFLSENYWNNRYLNQQIGWDLGEVSPPIKAYINQLVKKDLKILIPGAGNAYEAIYLLEQGFTNITVVDFAEKPLVDLVQKLSDYNTKNCHLIRNDFFNLKGEFDLIMEQTFFCAIHPSLRENYVKKTHQLLSSSGKIVGLLFNKQFSSDGPPFGGTVEEYQTLFQDKFEINKMENAYNSVNPRLGSELFINFIKVHK
jgi:hypothetical protein